MSKDVFLTMRITNTVKRQLKRIAKENERTMSNMIAVILKEYVDNNRKTNNE